MKELRSWSSMIGSGLSVCILDPPPSIPASLHASPLSFLYPSPPLAIFLFMSQVPNSLPGRWLPRPATHRLCTEGTDVRTSDEYQVHALRQGRYKINIFSTQQLWLPFEKDGRKPAGTEASRSSASLSPMLQPITRPGAGKP